MLVQVFKITTTIMQVNLPSLVPPVNRVLTAPGKSWIYFCKISRSWKVLKMGLVLESPGDFSERS